MCLGASVASYVSRAVDALDPGWRTDLGQITAEKEKGASLPTIKVVDESGREIWVNANHIAVFHEYMSGRPMVAFA
jgi:hypothetical protein